MLKDFWDQSTERLKSGSLVCRTQISLYWMKRRALQKAIHFSLLDGSYHSIHKFARKQKPSACLFSQFRYFFHVIVCFVRKELPKCSWGPLSYSILFVIGTPLKRTPCKKAHKISRQETRMRRWWIGARKITAFANLLHCSFSQFRLAEFFSRRELRWHSFFPDSTFF